MLVDTKFYLPHNLNIRPDTYISLSQAWLFPNVGLFTQTTCFAALHPRFSEKMLSSDRPAWTILLKSTSSSSHSAACSFFSTRFCAIDYLGKQVSVYERVCERESMYLCVCVCTCMGLLLFRWESKETQSILVYRL